MNRLIVYLPESARTISIPAHAHRATTTQLCTACMLDLTSDLTGKHKVSLVVQNSLTQSESCSAE